MPCGLKGGLAGGITGIYAALAQQTHQIIVPLNHKVAPLLLGTAHLRCIELKGTGRECFELATQVATKHALPVAFDNMRVAPLGILQKSLFRIGNLVEQRACAQGRQAVIHAGVFFNH